jgi:hypothetical protein
MNSISIVKDGKSVALGGGINSKVLTNALWAAGKQTGKHPFHMFEISSVLYASDL